MGNDIGSGLSSMAVCFDFSTTNIVQLSNWNRYFYRFRCHHPALFKLPPQILRPSYDPARETASKCQWQKEETKSKT